MQYYTVTGQYSLTIRAGCLEEAISQFEEGSFNSDDIELSEDYEINCTGDDSL
jgi:hypothetical protein